jgi:hypothetical protein
MRRTACAPGSTLDTNSGILYRTWLFPPCLLPTIMHHICGCTYPRQFHESTTEIETEPCRTFRCSSRTTSTSSERKGSQFTVHIRSGESESLVLCPPPRVGGICACPRCARKGHSSPRSTCNLCKIRPYRLGAIISKLGA